MRGHHERTQPINSLEDRAAASHRPRHAGESRIQPPVRLQRDARGVARGEEIATSSLASTAWCKPPRHWRP